MSEALERASEACIDDAYFEAVLAKPIHPIFKTLEPYLGHAGVAVDLGCGVGHATLFLLEKGYEVYAIDNAPRAIEIVKVRAGGNPKLHLVEVDMREWEIPACDVLVAGFSLFFLKPDELESFWKRATGAIKPAGLFAGQFLGVNDEWKDQEHALVDASMVGQLLEPFELLHYEEIEQEGETVLRQPKYWHIFHVVARKK